MLDRPQLDRARLVAGIDAVLTLAFARRRRLGDPTFEVTAAPVALLVGGRPGRGARRTPDLRRAAVLAARDR